MKIIKFISTGEAVSDFEISKFVDKIFSSSEEEFHISTNLVIDEIRARIAEKTLKPIDFRIYVQDINGDEELFVIDEDGRSRNFQATQEVGSNILTRLLGF